MYKNRACVVFYLNVTFFATPKVPKYFAENTLLETLSKVFNLGECFHHFCIDGFIQKKYIQPSWLY